MRDVRRQKAPLRAAVFLVGLLVASWAAAQSSTATIRGHVTDQQGKPVAGATISAVNTQTGFVKQITANPDGSFQMAGIPAGSYTIALAASGFQEENETLTVLVGQNLNVRFVMGATKVVNENIEVIAEAPVDMRAPEAATNVTRQQIENLPQDDRNFLNFAALAPGVRVSKDPMRKVFTANGQPAEATNVYIDGVSQKNDVLQGGAVGQDSSRGNPFPQNAVQEFRVITQNYSAQYEKASSAVISAVTKSGGNEIHGQAFWFYQPNSWVSDLPENNTYDQVVTNQDYKRNQPGFSIGGPIIKDQLHYFFSYERDKQDATKAVTLGNGSFAPQFGQYTGVFSAPFKSDLGFGKLSWQPAANQLVDWSGTYRKENEIRDFGGNTSFQSATDLENWVYGTTLRHQWNSNQSLNQAALSYQEYGWNPKPTNPDLVGQNYEGVIRIGGNSTEQKFDQKRLELRDDYNFAPLDMGGSQHAFQVGGNYDRMKYDVTKFLTGNPQYNYRNDPNNGFTFAQPYEAQFGFGNPNLSVGNSEFGVYGQDTWTVNPRLTLTLGLRWDYETDQIDESYVTPANIVAGLAGKVDASYFSNGHNRSSYTNEWQPRLGASYDLRGDGKSVLYAGAGRYYDRLFLNATLDERYRLQFPVYRIEFSPDGRPGTIQWNDAYLTPAGLHALIASGATSPEIYLLNNNTKPPYSDQFNIGYRQALGDHWVGSISYNNVRGHRGFTWLSATGICCSALVPGYGNVIISDPSGKDYWYQAGYLTLDRPFANNWGAHFVWTHAKSEQNGNDLFSLDYPSAAAYPRHEVPGTERDRIVMSGIAGLPWEIRFSANLTLGSGEATNVLDFSQGFSLADREQTHPFERSIYPPKKNGFAERILDFRLEKGVTFGRTTVSLIGEMFNAFNEPVYGCLNNFIPPEGNPTFGQPTCVTNLGRREQVGIKVDF